MSASRRSLLVLLFLIALSGSATLSLGRFTTTDEIAFKAAGREWARSGRFAAPELSGFRHLEPPVEEIWLAQLPVYTFAFGLFVRISGFGWTTSLAFDVLIHATVAFLTFALCRKMSPRASPWAALVAAALVLPLGTAGRADELAMCLAIGAIAILYAGTGVGRLLLGGLLFGVAAATSAVAAALLALHAIFVVMSGRGSIPRRVMALFIVGATAIIAAAGCLAPILLAHPDAIHQFSSHASGQLSGSLAWEIPHSWRYGKEYLLPAFGGIVFGTAAIAISRLDTRAARRFLPAVVAAIVVLWFVPAKSYYLWFVTPLLFAASAATFAEMLPSRSIIAAAVVGLLAYLGGTVEPARRLVIMTTLPPQQRLAPNVAAIRRIIPAGSVVAASEFWAAMADDYQYRSLVHGELDFGSIDYVILLANGSGVPGRPRMLPLEQQRSIESRFVEIHDNLPKDVPRVFGLPLSHSSWGFGTRIFRRIGDEASDG